MKNLFFPQKITLKRNSCVFTFVFGTMKRLGETVDFWMSCAFAGFEVLTAVVRKTSVLWYITPGSPWKANRRSEEYAA
jgi:hypothetical protein